MDKILIKNGYLMTKNSKNRFKASKVVYCELTKTRYSMSKYYDTYYLSMWSSKGSALSGKPNKYRLEITHSTQIEVMKPSEGKQNIRMYVKTNKLNTKNAIVKEQTLILKPASTISNIVKWYTLIRAAIEDRKAQHSASPCCVMRSEGLLALKPIIKAVDSDLPFCNGTYYKINKHHYVNEHGIAILRCTSFGEFKKCWIFTYENEVNNVLYVHNKSKRGTNAKTPPKYQWIQQCDDAGASPNLYYFQ
jgi:hypothetical protein